MGALAATAVLVGTPVVAAVLVGAPVLVRDAGATSPGSAQV